jgi:CHASE3 domain sensor protein
VIDLALLIELPAPLKVVAGFLIIMTIYSSFLGFTYWISKDE